MFARELTFAVIAFILVVPVTVFLSVSLFVSDVFALPPAAGWSNASEDSCFISPEGVNTEPTVMKCCWSEYDPGAGKHVQKCQTCIGDPQAEKGWSCDPVQGGPPLPTGDLPQLETVPPIRGLPRGGDVPTLEQVPPPGLQPGSDIPTLEQGPGFNQGTEGEPPLPVVCSEEAGLEKDPETGQCVPIESPVTEEPEESEEEPDEEQQQPEEEQQPSAEEEGSNDNNDN